MGTYASVSRLKKERERERDSVSRTHFIRIFASKSSRSSKSFAWFAWLYRQQSAAAIVYQMAKAGLPDFSATFWPVLPLFLAS